MSVYRSEWRELHARSSAEHSSLADVLADVLDELDELEARLEDYEDAENGGGSE